MATKTSDTNPSPAELNEHEATETELREMEEEAKSGKKPEPEPESEVRADEFAAGIGEPVGGSAWPDDIVAELRKPLDPNRIRRRTGRGRGQFEYLAGHDVKRRANELFGFGNWGHRIVEQTEIAAVEVSNANGGGGWHVGYRCVVEVWVRHDGGEFATQGSGFGDGVEYTPAARITACELALKESETDALKRAFTDLGDQFGLILYAKGDEKKRIESDSNAEGSQTPASRPAAVNPERPVPHNYAQAFRMFDDLVSPGDPTNGTADGQGAEWLRECVTLQYGAASLSDLKSDEKHVVQAKFFNLVVELDKVEGEVWALPDLRDRVARMFAERFDGVALHGPMWAIAGGEQETLPSHADYIAAKQAGTDSKEDGDESVATGPGTDEAVSATGS